MAFIEWSEKYSVGIASIDEQHQNLVLLINKLNEAMACGEASTIIDEILIGLTEYTKMHFAFEEALFSQHGYPESEAHIAQHETMIKRVEQFEMDFRQDSSGAISLELMQFMTNWLLHHIKKSDKDYADFLITKGVK